MVIPVSLADYSETRLKKILLWIIRVAGQVHNSCVISS